MKKKSDSKKSTPSSKKVVDTIVATLSKISTGIHTDLEIIEDALNTHELEGYIGNDGMPNLEKMDNSDITVKQVVIVSMASTFRHIHEQWHEALREAGETLGVELPNPHESEEDKKIKIQVQQIMLGEKTVKEIAPKDLPPEILDTMQDIVDTIRGKKKGKR